MLCAQGKTLRCFLLLVHLSPALSAEQTWLVGLLLCVLASLFSVTPCVGALPLVSCSLHQIVRGIRKEE